MFDGKSEAAPRLAAAAMQRAATRRKERERLVVPAEASSADKLAGRYASKDLGQIAVERRGKAVLFDIGEWKSEVASRKNDDGSISFITIEPTLEGLDFVVAEREGKRALVIRDAQHEYVFTEAGG